MTQRPIFRPMSYLWAVWRITASLTGNTVPASSRAILYVGQSISIQHTFLCAPRGCLYHGNERRSWHSSLAGALRLHFWQAIAPVIRIFGRNDRSTADLACDEATRFDFTADSRQSDVIEARKLIERIGLL